MRLLLRALLPTLILLAAVGCEDLTQSENVAALVAGQSFGGGTLLPAQTQARLQRQDGSCLGEGQSYGDPANAAGVGQRDRLRDGSCGL